MNGSLNTVTNAEVVSVTKNISSTEMSETCLDENAGLDGHVEKTVDART